MVWLCFSAAGIFEVDFIGGSMAYVHEAIAVPICALVSKRLKVGLAGRVLLQRGYARTNRTPKRIQCYTDGHRVAPLRYWATYWFVALTTGLVCCILRLILGPCRQVDIGAQIEEAGRDVKHQIEIGAGPGQAAVGKGDSSVLSLNDHEAHVEVNEVCSATSCEVV